MKTQELYFQEEFELLETKSGDIIRIQKGLTRKEKLEFWRLC